MKHFFLLLSHLIFFTHFSYAQQDSLLIIAKEVISSAQNCALITIDSTGTANVRTMDPFAPQDDFTIWLGTNAHSSKVDEINANPNVTLYYFDKEHGGYVTIKGQAKIVTDADKKEEFWKEKWKNFYKNKETDYALIQFVPTQLKVISEKHKIFGDKKTWAAPIIKF